MSDYTVNDVVKAALEKDMIGLKAAVGDQLGSRAQEAIDAMYPEVGASMVGVDDQDDIELEAEAEADEIMSDIEELEIDDSEEQTDEDV